MPDQDPCVIILEINENNNKNALSHTVKESGKNPSTKFSGNLSSIFFCNPANYQLTQTKTQPLWWRCLQIPVM